MLRRLRLDYMALFVELIHRLQVVATAEEVATWLEERRTPYQAVRMKMRVLLSGQFLDDAVFMHLKACRRESCSTAPSTTPGVSGIADGHFVEGWRKNRLDDPTPLERFTMGLWGLVKGRVHLVEKFGEAHAESPEYGFWGHPILALLEDLGSSALDRPVYSKWSSNPDDCVLSEDLNIRGRYIARARIGQNSIEKAWMDVVAGYAALKRQYML